MHVATTEYTLYTGGEAMFKAVGQTIGGARHEILLSLFTLADDSGGGELMDSLCDAAGREVRVRVVIDAYGSPGSHGKVARRLRSGGVEVTVFRPIRKWWMRPAQAYCRNHARLLLVDREVFGLGSIVYRDEFRCREDMLMLLDARDGEGVARMFGRLWRAAERPGWLGDEPLGGEICNGVRLLNSGPSPGAQEIYQWALAVCRSARKRIQIVTPFFFPPRLLLLALRDASRRGVRVELITPWQTDRPNYDNLRALPMPWLLARNDASWLVTPQYFHSKFCLIDDRWTLGSANFDVIAMKRNFELNICGEGGPVLKDLEACFERLKRMARPVRAHQLPLHLRLLPTSLQRFAEFLFALT